MLMKEGKTVTTKGAGDEKPKAEHRPLSAKSVRNVHGIFTKCLSTAVKLGYIKSNPADSATVPRVEKKEIQPLTDAQIEAFMKAVELDEYGVLLRVILITDLRESEALGLTWDCVDFKVGTLLIIKQLQKRPAKDGGFQYHSRTTRPAKSNPPRLLWSFLRSSAKDRLKRVSKQVNSGMDGRRPRNKRRTVCSRTGLANICTRRRFTTISKR
jgi:integrase